MMIMIHEQITDQSVAVGRSLTGPSYMGTYGEWLRVSAYWQPEALGCSGIHLY